MTLAETPGAAHQVPNSFDLLPDLAHEIRNPISSIIAFAELIEMDPATGGQFSQDLIRDAERIDRLLRDICALARAQSVCGTRSPEPTDITPILQELCYARPRVTPVFDAPDIRLAIDPDDLMTALSPILDNAIELSAADTPVDLLLNADESHAILTCRNIGEPIPDTILPQLTEPFFKRRIPTEMLLHSGLGLTIASAIISGYAGDIQITSECIDKGATSHQAINKVIVTLPLPG